LIDKHLSLYGLLLKLFEICKIEILRLKSIKRVNQQMVAKRTQETIEMDNLILQKAKTKKTISHKRRIRKNDITQKKMK